MPEVHPSYISTWKGVLRNVLGWPDDAINNFIFWLLGIYTDPMEGLYHEVAGYYVARFAVPERFRTEWHVESKQGELVTGAQLERLIEGAIEETLGREPSYSEEEWKRVRVAIEKILSNFDEHLPSFGEGLSTTFSSRTD